MYSMSDIADALMIHRELHDQMPFQNVLVQMTKLEQEKLIDILSEMYMVKTIMEPKAWYDSEPAWSRDEKYIWVWVENTPETIPL
jgi:hypothetical protein